MWKWFRRYWHIPIFIIGVLLAWILVRRWFPTRKPSVPPLDRIQKELEAIREGAQVDKLQAELGHEQAVAHIEDKFREELAAMDEERAAEAERLRADPEALTRYIIRGRS